MDTSNSLQVKDSNNNITQFSTIAATANQVLFSNVTGAFVGNNNFTYTSTTNTLSILGNIVATGVKTDNLYYANGSSWDFQQPSGGNGQIQFNSNGDFGANPNLFFNSATETLQVPNITATSISGTLATANQPNITNIGTLSSLNVTGNAVAGNIQVGGQINANGNVGGTNLSLTGAATTSGTVTTAAQPNITSVGTLTSLTSSGNISGANVTATTYSITGVTTGITAAGSTQGTATALTKAINVVSTVSAGQGVVLPTAVAGMRITVVNTSGATLLVYPASGGVINSLTTNAGYSLPALGRLDYIAVSSTQWYAMGAVYA